MMASKRVLRVLRVPYSPLNAGSRAHTRETDINRCYETRKTSHTRMGRTDLGKNFSSFREMHRPLGTGWSPQKKRGLLEEGR
jgi:hypothetical protein